MHSGKIVLVSTSGYVASRDDPLLRELIESQIELFCALGVDAEKWEDALDWMCMGADGSEATFITTTSHPGESEAEVIEFARSFSTERPHEVEVIRV
ncbi:hypothetical protein KIH07_23020 [Hydrogenophaga taeniospiralis]|jgi:hypothetical protein|uniref:DUF7684 family protein n=1 Tax=Hydrogenophaga taeniospiralis TaxID=65656 RepID=UPI001CFB9128|nr:hypothetical protein [Hydrogenophaga taeniospiralis]MCB4366617.1 hypothetical protein [Hydrogenophaga taeniospiralis]